MFSTRGGGGGGGGLLQTGETVKKSVQHSQTLTDDSFQKGGGGVAFFPSCFSFLSFFFRLPKNETLKIGGKEIAKKHKNLFLLC